MFFWKNFVDWDADSSENEKFIVEKFESATQVDPHKKAFSGKFGVSMSVLRS